MIIEQSDAIELPETIRTSGGMCFDKRVMQEGFGLTPSLPSIALVNLRIFRSRNVQKTLLRDFGEPPTHVNLQKDDVYGVSQMVRSMTPGEKAVVYAFPSQADIRACQQTEERNGGPTDTTELIGDGYVSEITFLQWARVEDVRIDGTRRVWKEIMNEGTAPSEATAPRFGDSVRVDLLCDSFIDSDDSLRPIQDHTFTLGDKSHDFLIEKIIQTMRPDESSCFFHFSENEQEVDPICVWHVFLREHLPFERQAKPTGEIIDLVTSIKQEGNAFFKENNLMEAETLYSRGLQVLEMIGQENESETNQKKNSLAVDIYNNLALVHSQEQKWSVVVEETTASVILQSDASVNGKAYVRRAAARIAMRLYSEAIEDLRLVRRELPQDKYVANLLSVASQRKEERKLKAKRIYEKSLDESCVDKRRQGRVKKWTDKRYGFLIDNEDQREYFFHSGEVKVRKLPVRLQTGDEVGFELRFDKTSQLRAANITYPDGSLLQGSDAPINEFEKRFLNQQIRTEILKTDFEEEHYKKYMQHQGMITPTQGTVSYWDETNGEGTITCIDSKNHFFKSVDLILEEKTSVRRGDKVEFGSMDVEGLDMKRAVDVRMQLPEVTQEAAYSESKKSHPNMARLLETRYSGECIRWDERKSYGFIRSPQLANNVFVHHTTIERSIGDEKCLYVGEKVEFDLQTAPDGRKHAVAVTALGGKPVVGAKKRAQRDERK